MTKVLLVIPPLPERSYAGKFMALDYLASALIAKKHKVKILDLDIEYLRGKDVLLKYKKFLLNYEPHLIGITNLSIQNDIANYLAWFSKKILKSVIIIKGGFHETMGEGWRYTLELHHSYIDGVVVGEGEEVIVEIADALHRNNWEKKKTEIDNLAYWDGEKAVKNGVKLWAEVDPNLYIPIRLNYYPEYNFEIFNYRKTAQVMSVRGCPYDCAFCSEAVFPKKIHYRNIDNLKRELEILEKEGYLALYFDDPTFTLREKHYFKIIDEMKTRGLIWGCNTRVDRINENDIVSMAESGCVYIFCGVESLIPETLKAMRKTLKSNPKDYIDSVPQVYSWMRKVGIAPSIFLIFGNARLENNGIIEPEKWEDVEYTLDQAIRMDTDYISMNVLRLLPGVHFSTMPEYFQIRPTGKSPIHGGHYDTKWYLLNGKKDLRSIHPIYRCFEGSRSVHAKFVNPQYAYKIIKKAIRLVNAHNLKNGRQIRIVVDYKAANKFFFEKRIAGRIQYEILPFNEIPKEVEKIPLLEEWKNIIKKEQL